MGMHDILSTELGFRKPCKVGAIEGTPEGRDPYYPYRFSLILPSRSWVMGKYGDLVAPFCKGMGEIMHIPFGSTLMRKVVRRKHRNL